MAAFTITVSNSLGVLGPSPPMQWGLNNWGVIWGSGTGDTAVRVGKVVTNALQSDTTITFRGSFYRTVTNTMSFSEDLSNIVIKDPRGYALGWSGGSSNGHSRVISTYSTAAAATSTYSSSTAAISTWS